MRAEFLLRMRHRHDCYRCGNINHRPGGDYRDHGDGRDELTDMNRRM